MNQIGSHDTDDFDQYVNIFEDHPNTSNLTAIRQFIQNAIWSVKVHDFKTRNLRKFLASLRQKLHLDRKPAHSGYDRHLDIEQRRYFPYFVVCHVRQTQLVVPFG